MPIVRIGPNAKASEVIKLLDDFIRRYGDLPVVGDWDNTTVEIDAVDEMSGSAKGREDAKAIYLSVY